MTQTLLAIPPHLDDAAFSAGAALATRARCGWRVVIATIFTASVARPSGFALACQLDKGLPADVDYMALRREEDAKACSILGAEHRHLPLKEAPHRGYANAAALFGPVREDDAAWNDVPSVIAPLLQVFAPAEIWAPRAVGGHVDHVLVHRGLRRCAPAMPIRWWTDFPYASRPAPPDPESAYVQRAIWIDEPASAADRATKVAACAAYSSQLAFQFGGLEAMADCIEAQHSERFAETASTSTCQIIHS